MLNWQKKSLLHENLTLIKLTNLCFSATGSGKTVNSTSSDILM